MPELSPELLDAETLSAAVYNYWISLLTTDNAEGVSEMGKWGELEEVYKDDFKEAMQLLVIDAFKARFDMMSSANSQTNLGEVNKQYACYTCARVAVNGPGTVCDECEASFPRSEYE